MNATSPRSPSPRIGAGIKLAALVFTLVAIAVVLDFAWLAPGRIPVQDAPRASAPVHDDGDTAAQPAPQPSGAS
jgi:hypothetical protein